MRIKDVAPIVLTAVSIISSIGAVVCAINETPAAIKKLDDHRLEIDPTGETDLELKEKMIDYAKGYWKTGVCLGVSITTSVASCAIGHKNYRALMASTAALSAAYSKHKSKVKQFIGEEKAKLIEKAALTELKDDEKYIPKSLTSLEWFHDSVTDTDFQMTYNDFLEAKYDALVDLGTKEELKLGNLFSHSTLKKEIDDKKALDYTWFTDDLIEGSGLQVLLINAVPYNFPGQENDHPEHVDHNLNGGKPTYVIEYSHWPLPPSIAKDYQYIGIEES